MQPLAAVFGGSGFVGGQTVRALARAGYRVRVAVRHPGKGYRLRMLGDVGQIEVVQANLRDEASVARALDGASVCVNAVAVLYSSGRQSFQALHVDGAARLARLAKAAGVERFVQISALGADATSASAYARTKAQGEAAVRAELPQTSILRPSVIFGPEDAFFNRFAAMAAVAPALPLIGGGVNLMQPVYVADVALAVVAALTRPDASGQTFEVAGPRAYSFKALMELMLAVIQRKRLLVPVPFAAAQGLGLAGDLMAALGLPPPLTTDQIKLLQTDNVAAPRGRGLAQLGLTPRALEPILPTYLYRFRPDGQYADAGILDAA
jgi:NADH dehydrogenase